jgi:O-antigen/teichoic acid export membrane protein
MSPDPREQPPAGDEPPEHAALSRRVFLSTFSNYVGQIVTIGVWFLLTPFILDRLGATQYGLWVLVASFLAYGTLLDLGVNEAVVKYVAEHRAKGDSEAASGLIATTLRIYMAVGLGVFILGFLLAGPLISIFNLPASEHDTGVWLVRLTALGLAVELPAGTAFAVLRGLHRFDLMNLIGSAAILTLAAGTAIVLLLGGGVLAMAAITVPLTLVWQIPAIHAIHRTAPDLRFGLRGGHRGNLRTVASFSSALFGLNVANVIKRKTDEIVIAASLPVAAVAPYSVARRVSELPEMLTFQFAKVLMPLASELHAEGDQGMLRAIYVNSMRLALGIFVAVGAAMVVFAEPLLVAWVGRAYAKDSVVVVILTGAGLAEVAMWPAIYMLQGMDRHRPLVIFAVGSAVLNLGLSIWLVGPLDVKGVALATLIASGLEMLLVVPYAMRVNRVRVTTVLRDVLVPVTLPLIPAAALLVAERELLAPSNLVTIALAGFAGAVAYGVCFLCFPQAVRERALLRDGIGRLRAVRST